MATTLKNKAEEIIQAPKKISLTHDNLKKLREKINSCYKKNFSRVSDMINDRFIDQNGNQVNFKDYGVLADSKMDVNSRKKQERSVLAMYNELYKKVELDEGFKENYEEWAEKELMNYLF